MAVTLSAFGCATDRSVIDNAQQMHGTLQPAVMRDPQLSQYLQKVGDRIIDAGREAHQERIGPKAAFEGNDEWMFSDRMQFHLVNSKTVNAFTTGGEHMYIYNELLQQAQTEDELAAVMAHEYAHVYGRHVQKGTNRQLPLLIGGALAGGAAGYALGGDDNKMAAASAGAGLGGAAGQFANMGFTRKDEDEADKYGFYFYTRAGWDPRHFDDFFEHMIEKGYDKTPAMLSDHPTLASRVESTERRTSELPPDASRWRRPPVADAKEFAAIKQRAASLGKKLPDDRTLAGSQKLLQALPRSCVAPVDPPDAIKAREDLAKQAQANQSKKSK
ncbi:MAG: M48 family metalloprotease [Anaerolineae bacterium]|nr:M48 family metalloprotease [Phycisphaerae bacterium]